MQTANNIFIHRRFQCPVAELYTWLIQPDRVAMWFGPQGMTVGNVEIDLRVGGKYAIELIKPDQSSIHITGEYLEISPADHVVFSLQYAGMPVAPPKSIVKIVLSEVAPDETHLSLFQDFDFRPSDMEGRTQAWEYMFQILDTRIKRH